MIEIPSKDDQLFKLLYNSETKNISNTEIIDLCKQCNDFYKGFSDLTITSELKQSNQYIRILDRKIANIIKEEINKENALEISKFILNRVFLFNKEILMNNVAELKWLVSDLIDNHSLFTTKKEINCLTEKEKFGLTEISMLKDIRAGNFEKIKYAKTSIEIKVPLPKDLKFPGIGIFNGDALLKRLANDKKMKDTNYLEYGKTNSYCVFNLEEYVPLSPQKLTLKILNFFDDLGKNKVTQLTEVNDLFSLVLREFLLESKLESQSENKKITNPTRKI